MVSQQGAWRSGEVASELDRLRRDLGKLKSDLGKLTSVIWHAGRESALDGSQHLRDRLSDPLHSAYASARRQGNRIAQTIGDKVEQRPLASVLTAVVVGMLLAGLLAMLGMSSSRRGH